MKALIYKRSLPFVNESTHKHSCQLNHACKLVRPGRSFLRRMLDVLQETSHHPHWTPIRLNTGFQADLAWWSAFVRPWNGVSYIPPDPYCPPLEFTSDASGSWGCEAWFRSSWFQIPWDSQLDIATKELLPRLMACAAWGASWSGHRICCRCDNQVV